MKSKIWFSALIALGVLCQCSPSVAQSAHPASKPARVVATRLLSTENTVTIPGPLRSFLRMAGISQQISPEDVLPLLARNAYSTGYLNGVPTEYLRLIQRYLTQARELQMLAGAKGELRVSTCAEAEPLLSILAITRNRPVGKKTPPS